MESFYMAMESRYLIISLDFDSLAIYVSFSYFCRQILDINSSKYQKEGFPHWM